MKSFKQLCMPATIYLVLSLFAMAMLIIQNFNNSHTLCVGNFSCPMANTTMFYLINILYVLFWTWILQLICKAGWKSVSWVLLLFPFIIAFLFVISGMTQN